MPTYDYECTACDHKFELFQKITDAPIRKCPECKKLKLNRLFGTGAAIVFKGSGFYQTDYRSDSYKQRAESDKKSSETGASDGKSTSSDSGTPSKADSSAAKSNPDKSPPSESKSKSRKKTGDS